MDLARKGSTQTLHFLCVFMSCYRVVVHDSSRSSRVVVRCNMLTKFSIKWEPPPFCWLKINFDGSVRNNMASVGFIIRDADGHLLLAGAKNIGEAIMTVAECIAPRDGLAYAIHNG
ncbi:hypothetical protein GBA52_004760 [Prunus armeniaca]|nr:hypothetical protein GBA52_004760 [Prunus armeniaca]